jgi:ElaB/YqjD/DUF883 family membrane-anchored ribosome-binding protein
MGRQVIKQPDGLYCIFSSIVDDVIAWNATAEEVVSFFGEDAKEKAEEEARRIIEAVNKQEKPYHQFTLTYKEMCRIVKNRHGKDYKNGIYDADDSPK